MCDIFGDKAFNKVIMFADVRNFVSLKQMLSDGTCVRPQPNHLKYRAADMRAKMIANLGV
jgi:hypothetical protein